jgi:tetratricopeptide (TPR) repeat protein
MALVGIHLMAIQGQSQTSLQSTANNRVESAGALAAYRRGLDQYSEGNNQDAINSLRQAIVLNPSFTEAYNSLCVVYDHVNRTDDAIDVCERATVLRSDFVPAFYNPGVVYDAANRRNEAIASLKRAIQLNPGYVQAHYHLGRIYDASGDYEQARKFLKQAISLRPGYADAYNELGFSYCSSGQFDNAIGTFRQAVILEPDQARFHSNLGTTYYLAGRYDEAIACLSRAIDLKSDFLVAHDNLGVVYLKTGQYKQAIKHFQRAIELSKASNNLQAGLYNDLASSYAHLRKYKKAATLLNKALQINPNFTVAVFNLGVVDLMRQDRPAAFRQYIRLKQIDPAGAQKLYARIYGSRIIQAEDSANNTRTSKNLK